MKTAAGLCIIFLPLARLVITSSFGYRNHPVTGKFAFHNGVDLRARSDTVYSMMDGAVSTVAWDDLLGVNVKIEHDDVCTVYGHLSRVLIAPGDSVTAGQPVAITGNTGRVTGEHLHFSVLVRHRYVDPIEFIYQTIINNRNHE
jgi:murein DD-endopeptidase MepM/ murein hydrolase activator NlpD